MGFRAAIFDMDGTILDTLEDLYESVNASLRWAGCPERSREEVRHFVGNGAWMLIRRAVPREMPDVDARRVLEWYRPYYEEHAQIKTAPYPGIPEALETLRAAGCRLAVVSNKPDGATRKLAEHYFPGAFDAVIGAREGVAVKPAPDALLDAMDRMGVRAAETVYVGDSEVDIATARNAGLPCISVAWGFREEDFLRRNGASFFARSPEELIEAVLGPETV